MDGARLQICTQHLVSGHAACGGRRAHARRVTYCGSGADADGVLFRRCGSAFAEL